MPSPWGTLHVQQKTPHLWKDRLIWLAAADAAAGCQLTPLALGKKEHAGTAGKGDGINRAERRGTHCYTQTPSTKSFVPRRSQMPQFFHQCLRAGNLSTFIIPYFTACFSNSRLSPSKPSSVSPAQISTCALHSPDSSRHLNQLPPICCPPQFQHPRPTLIAILCTPPPTTSRQGQCPYTAFSGHLQTCKQAGYVVSSFADLQVSA